MRFTRLDCVDDLQEAQYHAGVNFGKYFFVSCWTLEHEESLPQWRMYGDDMKGVRLELPSSPFEKHEITELPPELGITISGCAVSPLSSTDLVGPHHFFLPPLSNEFFCGSVNYVDSVNDYYSRCIQEVHSQGIRSIKITGLPDLPKTKSNSWRFQSEYRFILFALPIPAEHRIEGCKNNIGVGELIGNAFMNNIDPKVKHIDVPLDYEALKKLVVRTGPLFDAGSQVCVEALIAQLLPETKLEKSSFAGSLREKSP